MDLKEKILTNTGEAWEYSFRTKVTPVSCAYEAMDELSKIVAIAFAKWVMDNTFPFMNTENSWCIDDGSMSFKRYTDNELYELFTQSKEYKELMDGK